MITYQTYGRRIRSALALPLPDGSGDDGPRGSPTISVRPASLPSTSAGIDDRATRAYESPSGDLVAYRNGRTVYWFADGVGVVRVDGSNTITVDGTAGANDDALARLVVGPGLRTALGHQGDVVVHASAVLVDGRAVAFTGPGGRGKSTTAAACFSRGHDVVTDDALPVRFRDGSAPVPAGPAELDVDAAARAVLGFEGEGPVDATARPDDGPWPLSTVYVLVDGDEFAIEEVPPRKAVFELLRASDGLYAPDDEAARQRHHEDAARVAGAATVKRLVRPRSLERLPELAARVTADVRDERA